MCKLMRKVTTTHLFWATDLKDIKTSLTELYQRSITDVDQQHSFCVYVKKLPYWPWRYIIIIYELTNKKHFINLKRWNMNIFSFLLQEATASSTIHNLYDSQMSLPSKLINYENSKEWTRLVMESRKMYKCPFPFLENSFVDQKWHMNIASSFHGNYDALQVSQVQSQQV